MSNATAPPATQNHFHSIDLLRGVASVFVAFYHFSYFLNHDNWFYRTFEYGYLGVDAFFLISGFLIPLSFAQKNYTLRDFQDMFLKRFIRIEPAYWASIGIMAFKDAFVQWYFDAKHFKMPDFYSAKSIALHFFHANAIADEPWIRAIYWTLAIDWQFYLFVCVAFFIIKRSEWWIRYPFYAAFALTHWYATDVWMTFWNFPFLAGIIYFHYYRRMIGEWELWLLWAAVFYVSYDKMGMNHLCSTTIGCLILYFFKKEWRWSQFMGKISYSFYLTHVFSGWAYVSILFMLMPDLSEGVKTLHVIVAFAISVPFAWWFYKLLEEPTMRWSKWVFQKK